MASDNVRNPLPVTSTYSEGGGEEDEPAAEEFAADRFRAQQAEMDDAAAPEHADVINSILSGATWGGDAAEEDAPSPTAMAAMRAKGYRDPEVWRSRNLAARGAYLLFQHADADRGGDVNLSEIANCLEEAGTLINFDTLVQLFNEINEDGDDSIEEDEFVQFVEGIRSSTQQEMLHFIALGLARSKTFWASFIFIISGLVGVFGTVVWWTPFSADTIHTLELVQNYMSVIGSIGFVMLSFEQAVAYTEVLENARLDFLNIICSRAASDIAKFNDAEANGIELKGTARLEVIKKADDVLRKEYREIGVKLLLADVQEATNSKADYNGRLQRSGKTFDLDNRNQVELGLPEWRTLMLNNNVMVSDLGLEQMFQEVDNDGNGFVEPDELEEYLGNLCAMTPTQKMATAVRATVSSVSFVLLLTFLVGGVGHKVNDLAFESNNAWLEFWSCVLLFIGGIGFVKLKWDSVANDLEQLESGRRELRNQAVMAYEGEVGPSYGVSMAELMVVGAPILLAGADGDGDGLEANELKELLERGNVLVQVDILGQIFAEIDEDGSGAVTPDEFANYLKQAEPLDAREKTTWKLHQMTKSVGAWLLFILLVSEICFIISAHPSVRDSSSRTQLYAWGTLGYGIGGTGTFIAAFDVEKSSFQALENSRFTLRSAAVAMAGTTDSAKEDEDEDVP